MGPELKRALRAALWLLLLTSGACDRDAKPRAPVPAKPARARHHPVDLPPAAGHPPQTAQGKPNVILIVIDTLRADHMSHYGYSRNTAEALDAFAAQATRFTRAYAPTGWTSPSVASLFTGLFPTRHGLKALGEALPEKWPTLAESLRDHGWTCVGYSYNHNVTIKTRFHRGFSVFATDRERRAAYDDISEMMAHARLWIDNGARPFFLYLQPMNVHGPYSVPRRRASALLRRPPSQAFPAYGGVPSRIMKGDVAARGDFTTQQRQSLIDKYDTAIRYTTDQLGALLARLQKRELYDDSLIVITSDHGEELFDHGGFTHSYSLYDEVLHIPLYIKLPRQTEPRTVNDWVSLVDVHATILDALELPLPPQEDGRSLMPLMRTDAAPREPKLFHVSNREDRFVGRALRWKGYKLIEIDKNYEGLMDAVRLFDLKKDPKELHDLSKARPEIVEAYRKEIARLLHAYRGGRAKAKNVLRDMDVQKLKALGYVQ